MRGSHLPDPAPDRDDVASCARCSWRVTGSTAQAEGAARVRACPHWGLCDATGTPGWAVRADRGEGLTRRLS